MSDNNVIHGSSDNIEGYEKIRIVGKGAFGLAVLYRRLNDSKLVVIKEINIIELSATERQFSLNEVQVLSSLNHPNIISYYRSFEKNGQLMIEMEYADGGNLNQLLTRRRESLSERAALHIYKQICAALQYMHQSGILHRDLKTANVFLTRDFAVKIGDFGISKVLTTRAQAQTVLGTPYYISPEMCEGKQYGPKSDIWASGCILYEMLTLHKPFEATNLPALVNRIIKSPFEPISEIYSKELANLIDTLLQKDPNLRPNAEEICKEKLPILLEQLAKFNSNNHLNPNDLNHSLRPSFASMDLGMTPLHPMRRSILYWWKSYGGGECDLIPVPLPPTIQISQVAVGFDHVLIVTTDSVVYSWGDNSRGQLGHGITSAENTKSHDLPTIIEALRGKNINKIAAGYQFSIFGNESGILMSCGEGQNGCLGNGYLIDTQRPKMIEQLLSVDIIDVQCGDKHVMALSNHGDVYTWGNNIQGQLGLDYNGIQTIPQQIELPTDFNKDNLKIRAGPNSSSIITENGKVLVWGSNKYNKLLLNKPGICGLFGDVAYVWKPTYLPLDFKVREMCMGIQHTAIISKSGQVYTCGNDLSNADNNSTLKMIKLFPSLIMMVTCGNEFTVACSDDNVVYFWGKKYFNTIGQEIQNTVTMKPEEILVLFAGDGTNSSIPYISIGSVLPVEQNTSSNFLYLLLHTTTPLPNENLQSNMLRAVNPLNNNSAPDWLKAELAIIN